MSELQQYLNRIQVAQIEPPSYAYLAKLQLNHLLAVPFENLSVIHHERIVLDEPWLVNKVVQQRRGGFCYELNGAFGWLLRTLGFAVDRISARVYNGSSKTFGPEFDHMALLVHLEQTYLVDVGFGDSARQPLALPAGMTEDVSGRYQVGSADQTTFALQKWTEQGWQAQYAFTTTAYTLPAYAAMCNFHQSSPQSHFTQRTVCTRATATGRLTLSADSLTITEGTSKEKMPVATPEAFGQMLKQYFGITRQEFMLTSHVSLA